MVITSPDNHGLFPNAKPRHPPTASGKSRVQQGSQGVWNDIEKHISTDGVIAFKGWKQWKRTAETACINCFQPIYQPLSAYKSPCFAMFFLPPGCHPRIRLSQAVDAGLGVCLGHAVRAPRAPFPGILHTFFGIFRGLSMGLLYVT